MGMSVIRPEMVGRRSVGLHNPHRRIADLCGFNAVEHSERRLSQAIQHLLL